MTFAINWKELIVVVCCEPVMFVEVKQVMYVAVVWMQNEILLILYICRTLVAHETAQTVHTDFLVICSVVLLSYSQFSYKIFHARELYKLKNFIDNWSLEQDDHLFLLGVCPLFACISTQNYTVVDVLRLAIDSVLMMKADWKSWWKKPPLWSPIVRAGISTTLNTDKVLRLRPDLVNVQILW